jgi:hypothetical protein
MPANGAWDLTQRLRGTALGFDPVGSIHKQGNEFSSPE